MKNISAPLPYVSLKFSTVLIEYDVPLSPISMGDASNPADALVGRSWPEEKRPVMGAPWTVRVVLGPQDDLFQPASVETFLTTDWKLSPISDRMGCRYIGPKLEFLPRPDYLIEQAGSDPSNIVDDGTPLGGIQVPSGLEPIVMGADVPSSASARQRSG